MNKKLVAALSGGAALVLALSGCGGDDDGDKKVNAWAKGFCEGIQPQLKKIQAATASIQGEAGETDSKKLQKTQSAAFQQISEAYTALAKATDNAGPPPVDDGEATQKATVRELNASSKAYAELKKSADELNTNDKQKFAAGLQGITDQLEKIRDSGSKALDKLEASDAGKAMAKQEVCQKTSVTPAPSPKG